MKFFDVRYSAQQVAPSPWAAEAPVLQPLAWPERLWVPVMGGLPLPPGAVVFVGQPVTTGRPPRALAGVSPANGRVIGTRRAPLLNGRMTEAVEIEPDAQSPWHRAEGDDPVTRDAQHQAIDSLNAVHAGQMEHWLERLAAAGIWADRPGCPDLLGQLQQAMLKRQTPDAVDAIVCNLLDDEPTMRLNSVLAAHSGAMLLCGLRLLSKLTAVENVTIVREAAAPHRWWLPMRRMSKSLGFALVPMTNDYPQSDATLLLAALLNRRLPPGRLPTERRVLLIDAPAAIAIGRFATRGIPMLQTPLAIRDHVHGVTHLLIAPIGTPLRQALLQINALSPGTRLLRGDVLHENPADADAIVSGGELTVHVLPRVTQPLSEPCIRCSWCVQGCPARIHPAGLLEAAQRQNLRLARRYGLDHCIECGVCTYVCPSHLPLLAGIRTLKSQA